MLMMMDEDREHWKQVEGFEGYEVSTKGRVRSYWKRKRLGQKGTKCVISPEPQRYITPYIASGYYMFRNSST